MDAREINGFTRDLGGTCFLLQNTRQDEEIENQLTVNNRGERNQGNHGKYPIAPPSTLLRVLNIIGTITCQT